MSDGATLKRHTHARQCYTHSLQHGPSCNAVTKPATQRTTEGTPPWLACCQCLLHQPPKWPRQWCIECECVEWLPEKEQLRTQFHQPSRGDTVSASSTPSPCPVCKASSIRGTGRIHGVSQGKGIHTHGTILVAQLTPEREHSELPIKTHCEYLQDELREDTSNVPSTPVLRQPDTGWQLYVTPMPTTPTCPPPLTL